MDTFDLVNQKPGSLNLKKNEEFIKVYGFQKFSG